MVVFPLAQKADHNQREDYNQEEDGFFPLSMAQNKEEDAFQPWWIVQIEVLALLENHGIVSWEEAQEDRATGEVLAAVEHPYPLAV